MPHDDVAATNGLRKVTKVIRKGWTPHAKPNIFIFVQTKNLTKIKETQLTS